MPSSDRRTVAASVSPAEGTSTASEAKPLSLKVCRPDSEKIWSTRTSSALSDRVAFATSWRWVPATT